MSDYPWSLKFPDPNPLLNSGKPLKIFIYYKVYISGQRNGTLPVL